MTTDDQARPEEDAEVGFETVLDGWCKGECFARTRVGPDLRLRLHAAAIQNVVPDHERAAVMTVGGIGREYPPPRHTVFPGCVDEEGSSGFSVSTETCFSSIHAYVSEIHIPRERLRDIEAHAQNAVVRQPKVGLRIKR